MDIKSEFMLQYRSAADEPALPRRISSRYRLESCLAGTESGGVWLMRGADECQYILKIDRAGRQALAREYAVMGQLPGEFSGLVPMPVDYFEQDDTAYLVRTYLPGRPLAEIWRQDNPRCAERCVSIGVRLCALLERLHGMTPPVIHRDIKPENIILSPEGEPALIDFGIARNYRDGQGADTVFMGTRRTAAPEQYGYTQTDQRTDLYALGVTLAWMLTGSYDAGALDGADCPNRLKRCLRKAVSFDPSNRYSSAKEMGRALACAVRPKPKPAVFILPTVCLAALLAALIWFAGAFQRPDPMESPGPSVSELASPVVQFQSPLLEQAVRAELELPQGDITLDDLRRVRRLAVVGQTLLAEGQSYEYRLTSYVDGVGQGLGEGSISDLAPLADMPNLTELYLCGQQISDLTPLEGLPLEALYLSDNQIADLSPLAGCPRLHTLFVGGNPLYDLSPLASLTGLRRLNLDRWLPQTAVDSFAPLAGLSLEYLSLGNLMPADGNWQALGGLSTVNELWLWSAPSEALSLLEHLTGLRHLKLGNCWILPDMGAPLSLPGLTSLSLYNAPEDLGWVEQLSGLDTLSLCGLPDVSLEPLAELPALRRLFLYDCQISDYSPLSRAARLELIDADAQARAVLDATCPEQNFEVTGG